MTSGILTNLLELCKVILHKKYQKCRPSGIVLGFSLYNSMFNKLPAEQSHFWRQGHNLNKLGKGPPVHIPNIKELCIVVSVKKIFMCSHVSLCNTCEPYSGSILAPRV